MSSSEEISNAEPCGIEKALKSISLNYTVSCTSDDIKEESETLHVLGISLLAVNFLFFPLTLFFLLLPRICKLVVCILVSRYRIRICIYNVNFFNSTFFKRVWVFFSASTRCHIFGIYDHGTQRYSLLKNSRKRYGLPNLLSS